MTFRDETGGTFRPSSRAEVPADVLNGLWALAAALAAGTAAIWLLGGYHAGFFALNDLAPAVPAGFWSVLTCLGDSAVALAIFLGLARGNLQLARIVLIACALGLLWTHGFKQTLPLLRPVGVLEPGSFYALGATKASQSFPSGHAQTAMTLAAIAVLCTRTRVWQVAALVLGLAAALSRVFVGVHWPVDVLAGAAGGLICVAVAVLIDRRLAPMRPVWAWTTVGLCTVAAVMVAAGYPPGYPAARPWLRGIGVAALVIFYGPIARSALGRRAG